MKFGQIVYNHNRKVNFEDGLCLLIFKATAVKQPLEIMKISHHKSVYSTYWCQICTIDVIIIIFPWVMPKGYQLACTNFSIVGDLGQRREGNVHIFGSILWYWITKIFLVYPSFCLLQLCLEELFLPDCYDVYYDHTIEAFCVSLLVKDVFFLLRVLQFSVAHNHLFSYLYTRCTEFSW